MIQRNEYCGTKQSAVQCIVYQSVYCTAVYIEVQCIFQCSVYFSKMYIAVKCTMLCWVLGCPSPNPPPAWGHLHWRVNGYREVRLCNCNPPPRVHNLSTICPHNLCISWPGKNSPVSPPTMTHMGKIWPISKNKLIMGQLYNWDWQSVTQMVQYDPYWSSWWSTWYQMSQIDLKLPMPS